MRWVRWAAGTAAVLAVLAAPRPAVAGQPTAVPDHLLSVLQANLCNSGYAGCWTGRSVAEAAELIAGTRPDVVTLNEVCRHDVAFLQRVMARHAPGVFAAFRPAGDARTGGPLHCRDGDDYGVAILGRARWTVLADSGRYRAQDPGSPEQRVWLCVQAAYRICTTHLAAASSGVALAQCRELVALAGPAIITGDLNLGAGVRDCAPGRAEAGDGGVQHVLTPGLAYSGTFPLSQTDHPALLVGLQPAVPDA